MDRVRIAVLGAGALGSVVAARLLLAGHQVVAVDRPGSAHLAMIAANGLELTELDGRTRRIALPVRAPAAAIVGADLLLVLVKAWATEAAIAAIRGDLPPGTMVLSLQNGLGQATAIRRGLGAETGGAAIDLVVGATAQAARRLGPGRVRHSGAGATVIGREGARVDEPLKRLAATLTDAHLPTTAVEDIACHLWRKLAVNVAINGVTALAGVANGAVATDPALRAAAAILAAEVARVARALGLEIGDAEAAVVAVAHETATNRSSMLQDFDQGRRTEVEAIYGAVLAEATRLGLDLPATRVVAALLGAREAGMMGSTARAATDVSDRETQGEDG